MTASRLDTASDAAIELVEELVNRLQAGTADVEAFIAGHPEHATTLRRLLPAMRLMADLSGSAEAVSAAGDEAPPQELGDFRLVREVGRGGMGVVYEAEQVSLDRRVALKVLPLAATLDPKQLQRFRNEARAAAGLHHEHIVPVYAVGCEKGVHFYAMQFVEGRSLAEVIAGLRPGRGGASDADATKDHRPGGDSPTPPAAALSTEPGTTRGRAYHRRAAELVAQAADALEHAHSLGVVHRDVKPANLLLDTSGKLWVTDFGLARLGDGAGLTVSGDLLGTLRYMSPEQALAKHGLVDHRTDIYALGATLYELLTLRPAVGGESKQEVLRRIAFEEPAPLRKLDRTIPAELETVALKCLSKEPAERYATAKELADDLRRWLDDRPIRATRPSLRLRLERWLRRHLSAVLAAGVVSALAAVVLAGLAVWIWRLKAQADDALAAVKSSELKAKDRQHAVEELLSAALGDADVLSKVFEDHMRKGEVGDARRLRERVADIARRAADQPWLDADATQSIYRVCVDTGLLLVHSQRYEEAEELSRLGVALAEMHLQAPPSGNSPIPIPRAYRHLPAAQAFALRAEVLRAAGKWGAAEACARQALQSFDILFGEFKKAVEESEHDGTFQKRLDNTADLKAQLAMPTYVCLGQVLAGAGRAEEADKTYALCLDRIERKMRNNDEPYWCGHWTAAVLQARGDLLWALGRRAEATECYRQALTVRGRAAVCYPDKAAQCEYDPDALSWLLATCPDEARRDYRRAEELAAEAAKAHPWLHRPHLVRAIARYRAGDLEAAGEAFRQAHALYGSADNCHADFYRAMVQWRLHREKAARVTFDRAVRRMDAVAPRDEGLRRLRAEAAALLAQPAEEVPGG